MKSNEASLTAILLLPAAEIKVHFFKSDTIKVIELKPGIPELKASQGIRFI
jgi:hypothetical protein